MLVNEKIKSKIQIKELPPMKVATYRSISREPERDVISYMKDKIKRTNLNYNNLRKFGIDIPVSEKHQEMGLRGYEYWVCVPDDFTHVEGIFLKTIPVSNYAVLRISSTTENSFDRISNGWIALHEWVKSSGYKSALHNPNRYMLEEMLKIDGLTCLDLYYPVYIFGFSN